jgi:putative tryptophan/tyrosine transport system substrate-binding protein
VLGFEGTMRRREFIVTLGGAAAAWPFSARAQQLNKPPRLGLLAQQPATAATIAAFRQGLRDFGYVEGQNLIVEFRTAAGKAEQLPALAAELLGSNVDVIFASGSEATRAITQRTTTIPIVMTSANPLGLGFVASLARPGGNVTGLSLFGPEAAGKRLELLKELVPGLVRAAAFWNPDDPSAVFSLRETEAAAVKLGVKLQALETTSIEAVEAAFPAAIREGAQAIILLPAPLMIVNIERIAALALQSRLPTLHFNQGEVKAGGLISYGPDFPAIWRRAAYYVDRILKGAKPADLPVEQPTKFELVLNLRTAKALGLTVPDKLLALANEVIE